MTAPPSPTTAVSFGAYPDDSHSPSASSFSHSGAGGHLSILPSASGSGSGSRRFTNRMTNRYSVNAMYSLAAEHDAEMSDELARAQKRLRELKARISSQSKKNFILERDVRYLDARIALLIQNRMAAEEKRQVAEMVDGSGDGAPGGVGGAADADKTLWPDERRMGLYANLFFLLQSEPRHVASLCRLVSLAEIDTLLQTVMFTLYGNQYEQREEHLLLTMFQVSLALALLAVQFQG